jgi:hypothetical protein
VTLSDLCDDLSTALADVASTGPGGVQAARRSAVEVRPYQPRATAPGEHQLLLILKPEVVRTVRAAGGRLSLTELFARLDRARLTPGAVRILPGHEVRSSGLVRQHYSLLNEVSQRGTAALRPGAAEAVRSAFPGPSEHTWRVLGGHEFLRARPDFSPRALDVLVQNTMVHKLAAGVYASPVHVDGVDYLLLNGFHPAQVEHFERPDGAVILIECTSPQPLVRLRREVIGATDPGRALPVSVRGWLYAERDRFDWAVSTSLNAVHASPSSVEAMFAISAYFGGGQPLALEHTSLGRHLQDAGVPLDAVHRFAVNPDVPGPHGWSPIFDVTEDLGVDARPYSVWWSRGARSLLLDGVWAWVRHDGASQMSTRRMRYPW